MLPSLGASLWRWNACRSLGTLSPLGTSSDAVPFHTEVSSDHLPHDLGEQCDDGNRNQGDGCDGQCRVETGFIGVGGDLNQPDRPEA